MKESQKLTPSWPFCAAKCKAVFACRSLKLTFNFLALHRDPKLRISFRNCFVVCKCQKYVYFQKEISCLGNWQLDERNAQKFEKVLCTDIFD